MSGTTAKDTVEEFWGRDVLDTLVNEGASPGDPSAEFSTELLRLLGAEGRLQFYVSARQALTSFLRANTDGRRDVVLIGAFNCPEVRQAVLRADLRVESFDCSGVQGSIDWSALAERLDSRHCAVVVPHLFGVPTDFRPLVKQAQALGVRVLEDCAGTLGGEIDGQVAGTLADAAIFSFNYDKPLSLAGGGALLVNTAEAALPDGANAADRVEAQVELEELSGLLAWLDHRRQRIAGQPDGARMAPLARLKRLAARASGEPAPRHPFKVSGMGDLRFRLGVWQLRHYREIRAARSTNAERLRETFPDRMWHVESSVLPAYLKQKLICSTPEQASRVSRRLCSEGYRAGCFNWPETVEGRLGRLRRPNAFRMSRCSVDIPVHQNLSDHDVEKVVSCIADELRGSPGERS